MHQQTETLSLKTTSKLDIIDITTEAADFVSRQGISHGLLTISIPGSTASVTTIEYESGAVNDLRRAIATIIPEDRHYEHDARWGDGNGYAHVRAALMKPSLSIPVGGGSLLLGTWQQLVLLDFDNKPRHREVILHLIGS